MKKQNEQKGITLVALVITIIILLILASITISNLTNSGLFVKAKLAKEQTEIADIIERVRIDILGEQSQNKIGDITKIQLKTILEKYFKDLPEGELPDDLTSLELTTKDEYGGYKIKVSDIWNGSMEDSKDKGKTISDLYDGYNDPTDTTNYKENSMHIGDYVNYTAGIWDQTKALPTEETPFEFGGYSAGQSRDSNCDIPPFDNEITGFKDEYEGWRIWDISNDKKTITLISAGSPEAYYHPYEENAAYKSEIILTGNTTGTIGTEESKTPRLWTEYENSTQYAIPGGASILTKSDIMSWLRKYADNKITNFDKISIAEVKNLGKFTTLLYNRRSYWIAEHYYAYYLYKAHCGAGDFFINDRNKAFGIRILVTLSSDVRFKETPRNITRDGFSYNEWIIE